MDIDFRIDKYKDINEGMGVLQLDVFDPARRTEFEKGIKEDDLPSVAYFISYGALEQIGRRYKNSNCAYGNFEDAAHEVSKGQLVTLLGDKRLHILSLIDLESLLNSSLVDQPDDSIDDGSTLNRYIVTKDEKIGKVSPQFAEWPMQLVAPLPYDIISFADLGKSYANANPSYLQPPTEVAYQKPKTVRVLDNLLGNQPDEYLKKLFENWDTKE
jgi:hypothetical protein